MQDPSKTRPRIEEFSDDGRPFDYGEPAAGVLNLSDQADVQASERFNEFKRLYDVF